VKTRKLALTILTIFLVSSIANAAAPTAIHVNGVGLSYLDQGKGPDWRG